MHDDPALKVRIGVDTGGTFTDFVVYFPRTGRLETFKLPSTPWNPAQAVIQGLEQIAQRTSEKIQVIHGSTVATNALLEQKGARTALITTQGFRDVFVIGRQNRPDLYDLSPSLPPSIVPEGLRLDVSERINAAGETLRELKADDVAALVRDLKNDPECESAAVCLLFSFLNPRHEQQIASQLREAGLFVSASHEILPEYREYERMATTVVNAYVSPILDRYLGELADAVDARFNAVEKHPLSIMQSNGGTISPAQARKEAVRCILSGPAGGLIAADHHGRLGQQTPGNLMTIDMGGTSTDVSLITDKPQVTTEAEIGGLPIRVPVLDIHTIGAGGGSIAYIDSGGGLRVGPESAGANPGPACYGRDVDSLLPTVTDANLLLGRLLPDHFLGGEMPLYPERAAAAIRPLAEKLHRSEVQVAAGITAIANAHMARALRVISVARGHDPAGFSLVSFGGAGGLHAVDLARELGVPKVIVPKHASTFSALGMLLADVLKDYTRTVMLPGETSMPILKSAVLELQQRAARDLADEGVENSAMIFEPQLDVRFKGQSYELRVPFSEHWIDTFASAYRRSYGYLPEGEAIEIVNLRLQARGRLPLPEIAPLPYADAEATGARIATRKAWAGKRMVEMPVYDGERLMPGNRFVGPALLVRPDTTIWVGPGDSAELDAFENLVIRIEKGGEHD